MVKIIAIISVMIGLVIGANLLFPINTAKNNATTDITGTNIVDGTGTVTESGVPLYPGANVLDVTVAGNFTTTLASGTTGTAFGDGAGGYCTLIGSPVTLTDALVLDTGASTGLLRITLNVGGASGAVISLAALLPLLFLIALMVYAIKGIND